MFTRLLYLFALSLITIAVYSQDFTTTWETTTANESITIPVTGSGYLCIVDWGDGTIEPFTQAPITHNYTNPGVHTVKISGDFPRIFFNDQGDKNKILSVEEWGNIQWSSMANAFNGCSRLVINATDAPDLSQVTSLFQMFRGASSLTGNFNNWDVSNITNMEGLFFFASVFNSDLDNWNTANVTNMRSMFGNATEFNGNISSWNVSNVTNMEFMFANCSSFNSDISSWNVSNVSNFRGTFLRARAFNQNISSWDVSSATTVESMFNGARIFNQDIGSWDVANVTNFSRMFQETDVFNQNIGSWDMFNATDLSYMFSIARAFNQDINMWNVTNVRDMSFMFRSADAFDQMLPSWLIINIETMEGMFDNSNISGENYTRTLDGWALLPGIPTGIELGAANVDYCEAGEGRNTLISSPLSWTIEGDVQNCPPEDVLISSNSIPEENEIGDMVGLFSVVDQDENEAYSYELPIDPLNTDNGRFSISGDTLLANEVFDFEITNSYTVRVIANDDIHSIEKTFTISIEDVEENEAPSRILLSNSSIQENNSLGETIGFLSAEDPNTNDTHIFYLDTDNPNHTNFLITGDTLKANVIFDFETAESVAFDVIAEDQSGATRREVLVVDIIDEDDNPITSLEQPDNSSPIIYPNPVENSLMIMLEDEVNGNLQVYNNAGVLIREELVEGKNIKLNINDLPSGPYVLKLGTKNWRIVKK